MLRQSIYLSTLNLGGRALNFALYLLIANKYGASNTTDWFFFIFTLIYYFITILYRSVENVFVPLFNQIDINNIKNLKPAIHKISFNFVLISFFATFIFGFFISPILFSITPTEPLFACLLVCIFLCIQPSIALNASFHSSLLLANQSYTLPTLQLSIRTIGILAIVIIPNCNSIILLAFAYLTGELFRYIILRYSSLRYSSTLNHDKANDHVLSKSNISHNIIWIALALCSSQLNPAVDMAMVGRITEGGATLVNYAEKLRGFPILALNGLFILLLGEWSKQHHKDLRPLTFSNIFKKTAYVLITITTLTIPLVLYIDLWLPKLFFSNNFSSADVNNLTKLFTGYAPGIPFLAGFLIASNALVVYQKTKLIAILAISTLVINIPLNYLFINMFGLEGVAYSTTCLDFLSFLAIIITLKHITKHNS